MNPPDLIEVLNSIPGIGPLLPYILTACALSAIASTMMEAPADPASAYGLLWRLVNLLAANWGHARNAAQPAAKPPGDSKGPPTAGGLVVAAVVIAGLMGALAACTADEAARVQAAAAQAQADAKVWCQLQTTTGPALVAVAAAIAPTATPGAQATRMVADQVCAAINAVPATAPAPVSAP